MLDNISVMLKHETLDKTKQKPIRSFAARSGRNTAQHEQNIINFWPKYGLELEKPLVPALAFGRQAPLTLEIGFGNGQSLLDLAQLHPEKDFIGIEVYKTGVSQVLGSIEALGLSNVRVYYADAVEVLTHCIPDECLTGLHLFFPDPWPKARHHKRRIVQSEFAALIARKVKSGGYLHMATDWENYAQHMLKVMESASDWVNTVDANMFVDRPDTRVITKFEQRGLRLGHSTWDLIFRKSLTSNIL